MWLFHAVLAEAGALQNYYNFQATITPKEMSLLNTTFVKSRSHSRTRLKQNGFVELGISVWSRFYNDVIIDLKVVNVTRLYYKTTPCQSRENKVLNTIEICIRVIKTRICVTLSRVTLSRATRSVWYSLYLCNCRACPSCCGCSCCGCCRHLTVSLRPRDFISDGLRQHHWLRMPAAP